MILYRISDGAVLQCDETGICRTRVRADRLSGTRKRGDFCVCIGADGGGSSGQVFRNGMEITEKTKRISA